MIYNFFLFIQNTVSTHIHRNIKHKHYFYFVLFEYALSLNFSNIGHDIFAWVCEFLKKKAFIIPCYLIRFTLRQVPQSRCAMPGESAETDSLDHRYGCYFLN